MTAETPTWINDGQHESDLARFVLEGDEVVNHFVSRAVDELCRLTEHRHLSFASTVAAGSPDVLRAAVAALYLHLKQDHHLRYEYERDFIEVSGEQQVRLPGTLRQENRGTCLDLALLFASCLANAKLWPIVVVVHGHALAATWVTAPGPSRETSITLGELRGHLNAGKVLAVECTGFVEGFPKRQYKLSFTEACEQGSRLVQELKPDRFCFALDIRRAWERGVRPLRVPHEQLGAQGSASASSTNKPTAETKAADTNTGCTMPEHLTAMVEGITTDAFGIHIAFTVFNLSSSVLVVSDVVVATSYFNLLKETDGTTFYAFAPRTGLRVTISHVQIAARRTGAELAVPFDDSIAVRDRIIGTPSHFSQGKKRVLCGISLLAPAGAVHLSPGAAESFSLTLEDDSVPVVGFVGMFEIVIKAAHPRNEDVIELMLQDAFEVSREPRQAGPEVIRHRNKLLPLLETIASGTPEGHTWLVILQELRSDHFSPALVHDLLHKLPERLPDVEAALVLSILRNTDRSSSAFRQAAWIRSLLRITPLISHTLAEKSADVWRTGLESVDPRTSPETARAAIRSVEIFAGRSFWPSWIDSDAWLAVSITAGLAVGIGVWAATGSIVGACLCLLGTVLVFNITIMMLLATVRRKKLVAARREALDWLEETSKLAACPMITPTTEGVESLNSNQAEHS